MPLPSLLNGAKQCQVMTKRTKLRCKNLAAYGCKACRMHGAHKSKNVLRGANHPQYKNGKETKVAKAERSESSAAFRQLTDLGNHAGVFYKKLKILGRPSNNYKELDLSKPDQLAVAISMINKI